MKNITKVLAVAAFVLAQVSMAFAKDAPAVSDDPVVNYNAGVASYKKDDHEAAKDYFTKALITENKALESKTEYNIGNSLFKMAKASEAQDPDQAMDALKQAAHYYEKAIDLDPKDMDAKYNYELSQKLLKIIQERPKTQQQQQKNQDKQDKKEDQQQSEQQDQQQSQQKNQQNQQQGREEDGQDAGQDEEKKEGEGEKTETKSEGQLTEEEARMLASQFGQEGARLDLNKDHDNQERAVSKDW